MLNSIIYSPCQSRLTAPSNHLQISVVQQDKNVFLYFLLLSQFTQVVGVHPCRLILTRIFVLPWNCRIQYGSHNFKWIKIKNSAPRLQCSIGFLATIGECRWRTLSSSQNSAGRPCLEPLGLPLGPVLQASWGTVREILCEPGRSLVITLFHFPLARTQTNGCTKRKSNW